MSRRKYDDEPSARALKNNIVKNMSRIHGFCSDLMMVRFLGEKRNFGLTIKASAKLRVRAQIIQVKIKCSAGLLMLNSSLCL